MTLNIYLATSWRNPDHSAKLSFLKAERFKVYDFKNPAPGDNGFHWSEIDPNWKDWSMPRMVEVLEQSDAAERGFFNDMNALKSCDACIMLAPCGVAAHAEMAYCVGAGKPAAVYINSTLPHPNYPDLMIKMADMISCDWAEIVEFMHELEDFNGSALGIYPDEGSNNDL